MNILVCVKQVLDIGEIKPDGDGLVLTGVPRIVNPYDTYALETAARIKDAVPGTKITVLTAGETGAKDALKSCLAVGADNAWLVTDPVLETCDSLVVSAVLAAAAAKLEEAEGKFDLIFCGNQAINGDTAHTGPQLAERLGLPQITYGTEAVVENGEVRVKREAESGYTVVAAALPCLVCITQSSYEPRYPTIKSKMAANKAKIPELSLDELDLPPESLTSLTRITGSRVPPKRKGGLVLDDGDAAATVHKLVELLSGAAII